MPDTTPAWWPQVVADAGHRRHWTSRLLDHATPYLDGDTLRLVFTRPDIEEAWRDSRAQEALDAALQQHGIDVQVEVGRRQTATA